MGTLTFQVFSRSERFRGRIWTSDSPFDLRLRCCCLRTAFARTEQAHYECVDTPARTALVLYLEIPFLRRLFSVAPRLGNLVRMGSPHECRSDGRTSALVLILNLLSTRASVLRDGHYLSVD